jgi:hypothetical protein
MGTLLNRPAKVFGPDLMTNRSLNYAQNSHSVLLSNEIPDEDP